MTSPAPPALTPFSISPDPTALYLTPAIKTTVYKTQYAIEKRQGLAAILGDVGLGKSTIMRYVFSKVASLPQNVATFVPSPSFRSSFAMLKKISSDFGVPPQRSELAQQEALEKFVVDQYEVGNNVVIFVDEAQRLKPDQLEVVRVFLNFETNKEKMVQLVLAGQLDLRDRLLTKRYKPLLSRIFAPSLLNPLEYGEMVEMLRARCTMDSIPWPFTDDALRPLYDAAGGVPRSILKACQLAYGMMLDMGGSEINADLLTEVLQGTELHDEIESE
jgi:general secretion pathway protein A